MAESEDDAVDLNVFRKEFETWAEGVSPEARSAFACTGAARTLPNIGGIERPKGYKGFSFDLILLRAILTSSVASIRPTDEVKNATALADYALAAAHPDKSAFHTLSTRSVTSSAVNSAFSSLSAAAALSTTGAALYAAKSTSSTADTAISNYPTGNSVRSATKLLNTESPKALFEQPLWMGERWSDEIAANWTTLRGEWANDLAMAFWINWYEGLLKGRTPDWDLWHDIVLIEDEHWEAGPEAVAREIDILQSACSLEATIVRLEAELLLLAHSPLESGSRHNGGPELEDPAERLATIKLIQEQLAILRAEVDKAKPEVDGEPDPERVESAIVKIIKLVKKRLVACLVGGALVTVGGALVTGAANQVGADIATHYQISDKVIEKLDDLQDAGRKLIESLGKRPLAKKTPSSSSMDTPPVDL